jgi:type I restriction enzyme S subunit
LITGGDVLIGMDGTFETVVWKGPDALLNQRVIRIRTADETRLTNEFLRYAIEMAVREIENRTTMTTVKHLSMKELRAIEVLAPPLEEQRRIARIIGACDAVIEASRLHLSDVVAAQSAAMAKLYTSKGGWTTEPLGAVADVVVGGTPSTKEQSYWGGEITWLTPTEITAKDGKSVESSVRTITKTGLAKSSAQIVPAGSTLVSTRATIGPVALAETDLSTNQGITALVPGKHLDSYWLFGWARSHVIEFERRAAGNTFKEISRSKSREIPITFPGADEQRRIALAVKKIDNAVACAEAHIETTMQLRLALLTELLRPPTEIEAEPKAVAA